MWNKKQIILWVIGSLLISNDGQPLNGTEKVDIAVYFESLCPDSYNFIVKQLHPNWNDIKDYVNIRFIPFGKSMSLENGTKFACQHGSKECKGNRIMSCALSRIPDQDMQVEYVGCFMDTYKFGSIDANEYGEKCVSKLGLNFDDILQQCYQTQEGTSLQLQAEVDTNNIGLKFVPTIIYNGVFSQHLQDATVKDFFETVCNLIRQKNPDACSHQSVITL